jgi:hypothetical protein
MFFHLCKLLVHFDGINNSDILLNHIARCVLQTSRICAQERRLLYEEHHAKQVANLKFTATILKDYTNPT